MESKLDKWWASRTVAEKERIASKMTGREVHYPECTSVWMEASEERKQSIHDHCSFKHGQIQTDWVDGTPMT